MPTTIRTANQKISRAFVSKGSRRQPDADRIVDNITMYG